MNEVRYYAWRDAGPQVWRDEDRAMAHADIVKGGVDNLADAQAALAAYMRKEAEWLLEPRYRNPAMVRRAADLLEAADKVADLVPEEGKNWAAAQLDVCGLEWRLVRIERRGAGGWEAA